MAGAISGCGALSVPVFLAKEGSKLTIEGVPSGIGVGFNSSANAALRLTIAGGTNSTAPIFLG